MARDSDGIIQEKFAVSGDVGLGDLVIVDGWPIAYSTPGGKDPQRLQFNQLYRNLFALAVEINQKGPFLDYNATIDYAINAGVRGLDGASYKAVVANGPGTSVVDPVGNPATWQNISPISWVIKSGAYTAKASEGVFADTTGGAFTITLPLSPSIGDRVPVSDFKRNFATDNLTIGRNGEKINGVAADLVLDSSGYGAEFVYSNATEGWIIVNVVKAFSGSVIQEKYTAFTEVDDGAIQIPHDDTIPENTEGNEFMTRTITPTDASNILEIEIGIQLQHSLGSAFSIVALFQDSIVNALKTVSQGNTVNAGEEDFIVLKHRMVAGTTSLITFKTHAGINVAGTITFNGTGTTRLFGGTAGSYMKVTEKTP